MDEIFVGFEVGTGEEVYIEPSHLVVTGITRSGKTTHIESIINESGRKAILFKTKVGEKELTSGKQIPPFFKERSDWQYVQSLLEATLKERLKFERAWIIEVTKNTQSLHDVKYNIDRKLEDTRTRGIAKNVYTTLQAYFDLVLPQLEKAEFSDNLILKDGINIMDLEQFSPELQSLIIRSVFEEILYNHVGIVVVAPEFWKFAPERRGNPVKPIAEEFIRQGAANQNFLWIDSQDMAGVSKSILKQVSTWCLGRQSEVNEVKHTLVQIPLPLKAKPKPEEIQTLKVGEFYICTDKFTKKIYSKPIWLDVKTAREIALGNVSVDSVKNSIKPQKITLARVPRVPLELEVSKQIEPIVNALWEEIENIKQGRFYEVTPLEKIQKDFLIEAKNQILTDISLLDEGQKKILKFIEVKGKGSTYTELLDRVFKVSVTSRRNRQMISEKCIGLAALKLIKKDPQNRIYPYLKERIADRLAMFGATKDEINQVYDHILYNLQNNNAK